MPPPPSTSSPSSSSPTNGVRYRRLSTDEHSETGSLSADALKKQRTDAMEKVTIKLQALVWVLVASVVIYYTDFFKVILSDPRVDRLYFNLAMVCVGINTCIALYLTLWLPCVMKVTLDWSIYCPRMIPTATGVGVVMTFTLVRSLWPVWGFLSPLILMVVFMGFMFSLHFVPWPC